MPAESAACLEGETVSIRILAWMAPALLVLHLGSALAGPQLPAPQFSDPQRLPRLMKALPQIEQMMEDRMLDAGIPGLAYGIVIDGKPVLLKGLGTREQTGGAVDADAVFRIASMTKSFTGLAILKLRDAGKLQLDDAVSRHVPELARWQPPTRDSGPITIRQLLAHLGGLPEDNPYGDRFLDISPRDFSAWLAKGVPFSTAPGQGFEYSNLGYMILGQVVTQVSGRPYQHYIREEILKPLGMSNTFWSPANVPRERLVRGYRKEGDSLMAEPMLEDGVGGAMGGLMTSARDLSRYVAMMLSAFPPRDDVETAPVLRRTLREMQSGLGAPAITAMRPLAGGPVIARARNYGFGLGLTDDCRWGQELAHSGGLPGFGSHMLWLPEHGVGVFVMGNLTYAPAGGLARQALQILFDTGALQAREAQPSAELLQIAQDTTALVNQWSDTRAAALAASNLFLDRSLDKRRAEILAMREGLGACRPGPLKAENALRGKLRIDCDQGWLDATLTLAPTQPPLIQHLEMQASRPASAELMQMATALTRAHINGGSDLRLAPGLRRADLAITLQANQMTHGSCTLGEQTGGNGDTRARFKLSCERGSAELSLSMERSRLSRVIFTEPEGGRCMP